MTRWDLVGFIESGRIQDGWFRGQTPFLWSGGAGFRFSGRMMGGPKSVFRFYVAQALEWRIRSPIFYAMVDIG